MNSMEDWREFIFWWAASLFASTMVVVARLGMRLYGAASDPPDDMVQAAHWSRRRRWLAISEVSALPAFATLSVVLVTYYQLNPVAGVLISIAEGFIGFPLMLDGAAWLFRKKLGMTGGGANDHGGDPNAGGASA